MINLFLQTCFFLSASRSVKLPWQYRRRSLKRYRRKSDFLCACYLHSARSVVHFRFRRLLQTGLQGHRRRNRQTGRYLFRRLSRTDRSPDRCLNFILKTSKWATTHSKFFIIDFLVYSFKLSSLLCIVSSDLLGWSSRYQNLRAFVFLLKKLFAPGSNSPVLYHSSGDDGGPTWSHSLDVIQIRLTLQTCRSCFPRANAWWRLWAWIANDIFVFFLDCRFNFRSCFDSWHFRFWQGDFGGTSDSE